jgi:hypothetical protein
MSIDAEHPEPGSPEDDTLARHKKMAEVLDGKRQMDWSDWAMFICESKCLTPEGRRVALQAVDTLRRTLRDDFFQRAADWLTRMRAVDPDLPPSSHPVFSLGFWPANDLPWVYANLIRWAAYVQLFRLDNNNRSQLNMENNRVGRVLRALHNNLEPINWMSSLLQLEVAGFGLKAGWNILFEPAIGNNGYADVRLTNGSNQLLVETTSMRMSVAERKSLAFLDRLFWQLSSLEWQHEVRISGSLRSALLADAEDRAQWFQNVEAAARATGQDSLSRQVRGPGEGSLTVFRPTEATVSEPWGVEGDPVEAPILDRLIALLRDKNRQAEGSVIPIWVRVDESAGLWQITRFKGMTLAQTLDFFTNFIQEALVSFPHLAGIILSPGVLWVGNTPSDSLVERVEQNGGIALRCPIPVYHIRETIIVPQAGVPDIDTKVFADWYANENTWLDWALKQLQYSPFDALAQEPPGEGGT